MKVKLMDYIDKITYFMLLLCTVWTALATGVRLIPYGVQSFIILSFFFSLGAFVLLVYRRRLLHYLKSWGIYVVFASFLFLLSTVKYVLALAQNQGITFFTVYQIIVFAVFGFFAYAFLSEKKSRITGVCLVFSVFMTVLSLVGQNRFMLDENIYRLRGVFENPNIFALFSSVACFCSLYLFVKSRLWKIVYIVIFSVNCSAVLISSSRSVLFALLLGVAVFLFFSRKAIWNADKKHVLIYTLMMVCSLLFAILSFLPSDRDKENAFVVGQIVSDTANVQTPSAEEVSQAEEEQEVVPESESEQERTVKDRFSLSAEDDSSILHNLRYKIWSAYLGDASDFWLFGTDYTLSDRPIINNEARDPHNTYIYTLFRYGAAGVLLLLGVAAQLAYRFVRKKEKSLEKIAVFSLFCAVMLISCLNDLLDTPVYFLTLSLLAAVLFGGGEKKSKQSPRRVLQYFSCLNKGGAESRTMDIYRNIDRTNVQFDFAVSTEKPEEQFFYQEIKSLGGEVYYIESFKKQGIFYYFKQWKMLLGQGRYQAVHAHLSINSWIPLFFAWFYGVDWRVAHARNAIKEDEGMLTKLYCNAERVFNNMLATHKVYCSDEAREHVFGKHAPRKSDFYFLPNAIDLKAFQEMSRALQEIKKELDIGSHTHVIGTVGNSRPVKNHIFLVKVFHELLNIWPDSVLLIVGNDSQDEEAKQYAAQYIPQEKVKFLGIRNDIPDLLRVFDVFILPSFHEGAPGSVIEAQAANVPCILSDSITRCVDVHANLLTYLSLQAPISEWTNAIVKACAMERPPAGETRNKLKQSGYEVTSSAKRLLEIYGL